MWWFVLISDEDFSEFLAFFKQHIDVTGFTFCILQKLQVWDGVVYGGGQALLCVLDRDL